MGCDIHWMLERLDDQDQWQAVGAESYFYEHAHQNLSMLEVLDLPFSKISNRNYELFSALSGVRRKNTAPLASLGLPHDASSQAKAFVRSWGNDGHSHGVILGSVLLASQNPQVVEWGKDILAIKNDLHTILPEFLVEGYRLDYADIAGVESFHEKLRRLEASKTLKDFANGDHWRMIIFYDN